jgi:hypothetical protein
MIEWRAVPGYEGAYRGRKRPDLAERNRQRIAA